MDRRTSGLRNLSAAVIITTVLVACGSDGPAANLTSGTLDPSAVDEGAAPAPTEAPTEPEAPAPTEAPAEPEAPAATEPAPIAPSPEPTAPTAPDTETSDGGNDWLLPVLVIGGLLLIAVVIGGALSRSRQSTQATPAAPGPSSAAPSTQASLLSTSQWITDQLTLELMAAPPTAALQRWATERSRLDNVAIGAQQQYLDAQDPNWQPLAQTMSALAAAIDTSLALRAQEPPNAQLISESIDVVNGHRARLHQLLAVLHPTIDR
jgi:outer membrane biosynthesis protein TonB